MEKSFQELWKFINARGSVITVQEEHELHHVFDLMRGCDCQSYLEVGAAEGNSLYVLGHAVREATTERCISYIDYGEKHTEASRSEALAKMGKPCWPFFGDSTNPRTFFDRSFHRFDPPKPTYDCILIDGGHDFATVLSDSILYAPLANRYVFWHDIQLPEVRKAYEWFKARWNLGEYSEFIHSDTFGYGICKIKN